jgi:hypothetical protein
MTQDTGFKTDSLGALQSQEQLDLLNAMDRLRAYGVSAFVSLPQIVVCGDQSAGKSSVLEVSNYLLPDGNYLNLNPPQAITELKFPRAESLCTRFATQLVLRRSKTSKVSVSIISDTERGKDGAVVFHHTIQDFCELPALIEKAGEAMGLGGGDGPTFARDVLNIEISGPAQPHLTLVDLPGLIHAAAKENSGDVELVSNLVGSYMQNPRTIVLAVVTASNDYQNQIVLKRAKEVDPNGNRTLGVITKPDTIPVGSEKEDVFIALAKNEEIPFGLGWHVLRNLSYEERKSKDTVEERNYNEKKFFETGAWADISKDCCGVGKLRTRLSKLLYEHIKGELPKVYNDIRAGLNDCNKILESLGEKRDTVPEQKTYITRLSMSFVEVCKSGVQGQYDGYFFAANEEPDTPNLSNRLRANIERLGCLFEKTIREKGHAFEVVDALQSTNGNVKRYPHGFSGPKIITKGEALEHVKTLLENSRGRELRGTFNPLLIGNLFWDHSKRWDKIATNHVNRVFATCQEFLKAMVPGITKGNDEVSEALLKYCIDEAMNRRLAEAQKELQKLFADRRKHPKTYNHYFIANVQKARQEDLKEKFTEIEKQWCGYSNNRSSPVSSALPTLIAMFAEKTEVDMEKYACEQVLRNMLAYYKVCPPPFPAFFPTANASSWLPIKPLSTMSPSKSSSGTFWMTCGRSSLL